MGCSQGGFGVSMRCFGVSKGPFGGVKEESQGYTWDTWGLCRGLGHSPQWILRIWGLFYAVGEVREVPEGI